jgi:HD-GYP domain-containing protein (c-di-GMP phosphodiesterase class II)
MKTLDVDGIPTNHFFSEPVYIDEEFILTSQEMAFTSELKKALSEWCFDKVRVSGEISQKKHKEDSVDSKGREKFFRNDGVKLTEARMYYVNFSYFTRDLFTQIIKKKQISYDIVAGKILEVCEKVKANRRFLLQIQRDPSVNSDEDFLTAHAVKSTIISIIIGIYLKLPNHRLIELGTAALLHEIGMVKLPSYIIQSKSEISQKDRATLMLHPSIGFDMLKSFGFSMAISSAALEHHERENGSGYPYKLTGDKISLYGKIIAVACSYEAITSKRPHKDARGGYEGIIDLLRNQGSCYDDTVVRALVLSLSIYPIGQPVMLSNGAKGSVIDVNPLDPRYPIVKILGEKKSNGQSQIIETSPMDVYILSAITNDV